MPLISTLSVLALKPVLDVAIGAIESKTGLSLKDLKDKIGPVYSYLTDHFTDHSRRLGDALKTANARAWRTLEIALAGESWKTWLDRQEDKAFREQIRTALDANPLNAIVDGDAGFRSRCLAELRDARACKRLTSEGPLEPDELFRQVSDFARFDQPAMLLEAEWNALGHWADALRPDYPNLASLLKTRPKAGPSPLVLAVRYYFRRAAEQDTSLFRAVSLGQMEEIGTAQAHGFDALHRALDAYGQQLEDWLDTLHDDILDIKAEQARQGQQLGQLHQIGQQLLEYHGRLDRRVVRPTDSFSIRNEDERRQVKVFLERYRSLPDAVRGELPALLYAAGKLEYLTGEHEAAQRDFQGVAAMVVDSGAKAEAQFGAYRAALETRQWPTALEALKQALELDPDRFAPFPLRDFEPLAILGAGGFGVAFLCRNIYSRAQVVFKALMPEEIEGDITTIFREATLLETLRHGSIIRLLTCGYADPARTRPYLILEHFEGMSLEDHVHTKGVLSVDDLLLVARRMAEALRAAHQVGILHRDVKPGNLLVRRTDAGWDVRLIDFGLVLRQELVQGTVTRPATRGRSIVGSSIAGTIDFAAPEQLGKLPGVVVGPYSDVYGFGKTCFHALFGTPKPDFEDLQGLPDPWRSLLTSCAAEKVSRRPASFDAVLERPLDSSSRPPKPPIPVPKPAEPAPPTKKTPAGSVTPVERPKRIVSPSSGMELASIPDGKFWMGSDDSDPGAFDHEKPRHRVQITRPFFLGVHPVMQEQYQKVVGTNPSQFKNQPKNPMEYVSWVDAVTFCNKLSEREKLRPYYQISGTNVTIADRGGGGYRLPTEAEWEYACRAGSETPYSFGSNPGELDKYAWYDANSGGKTQPVGQKPANAFGLHDMHGNVWEWCWDGYDAYDASTPDASTPAADPSGPSQAAFRVIRGGSWNSTAPRCRSANRSRGGPGHRFYNLGFRVALVQSGP